MTDGKRWTDPVFAESCQAKSRRICGPSAVVALYSPARTRPVRSVRCIGNMMVANSPNRDRGMQRNLKIGRQSRATGRLTYVWEEPGAPESHVAACVSSKPFPAYLNAPAMAVLSVDQVAYWWIVFSPMTVPAVQLVVLLQVVFALQRRKLAAASS